MKWFLIPVIYIAGVLVACATFDGPLTFDQMGHRSAGKLIACDLVRHGATGDEAVKFVREFARERERLQGNERCGDNCQRDMRNWVRGAKRGVRDCG